MSGDEPQGVEQRFAGNLRRVRQHAGISQADLARRMTEHGWPYHQQTVGQIERCARSVRLGEATTLASVLNTSLDKLTKPTDEMRPVEMHVALTERMVEIKQQARLLIEAADNLMSAIPNEGQQ